MEVLWRFALWGRRRHLRCPPSRENMLAEPLFVKKRELPLPGRAVCGRTALF